MDNITLLVDSGSDYESFLATYFTYQVRVIPLHLYIDGKEYLDGVDITKNNFYKEMEKAKELPKTSQPTPHNFYEIYNEELSKGNKVLYIGISSKLSGTFQSALIAKQMLTQEEQKNIYLVDALNLSATIIFLLFKADSMLKKGTSIEEVVKELESYRTKVKFIVLLDSLENLKKSGRISKAQATIGGVLNIKPLVMIEDGLLKTPEKFRGRKKGLRYITDFINNDNNSIDKRTIFFVHSYVSEERFKEEINELDLSAFKEVIYIKLGTTIGTHAGANTVGLAYQIK